MGKFLRHVAVLGFCLILLEVVQKTVFLHHLLTFENQREDGWFPGQGHALNLAKIPLDISKSHLFDSSSNNGDVVASNYASDPCQISPSFGVEGKMGFQALTKIQISSDPESSIKLLCIVMTDSTQHSTSLEAVLKTYAPQCDGFTAASNETDDKRQAIKLYSSSDNEWDRFSKVWSYVRTQHLDNYTATHFGKINTYVIPENLKKMVSEIGQNYHSEPMILGGAVVPSIQEPKERFCGGEAGFTVNRLALNADLQKCKLESLEFGSDRLLGLCLDQLLDTKCRKTTDSSSALRYLEFGVDYHANWNRKVKGPIKNKPLSKHHGIFMQSGLNGVSTYTASFNLDEVNKAASKISYMNSIERVHAILKGHCKEKWDIPVVAHDEDGNPGYIHDSTYLRRNILPFTKGDTCELPFGQGPEGKAGYRGLKKIQIMPVSSEQKKVLCLVYTHSGAHNRIRAIAETYGPRCDGFMAASNHTDLSIGAVHLLHEGPEAYKNMWLKVRAMFEYAHQHYRGEYDFFHIGGDDHYVIAENLKHLVSTGSWKGAWNQSAPLLLGGNMIDYPQTQIRYCGGGSGYTLNRVALKILVEDLFDTHPCRPHFQASVEDRIISSCFSSVGIQCMDTNDELKETRYHQATANFHVKWRRDTPSVWRAEDLMSVHGITSLEGMGQISTSTVSFHLKDDEEPSADPPLRRYHAILYSCCSSESC